MAVKRASALCVLLLCAEAVTSAPLEVKVMGDRVNLRARPLFNAEVAGQVSSGTTLLAPDGIPDGAEWVKVRPPQSVDLWIFSALVKDGVVIADDTYVRHGPGQQYKHVGKVGKGFKVEVRGPAVGDWLPIAPVPTAELFISSSYVLAVPEVQISEGESQISSPIPEAPKTEPTSQLPAEPTPQLPTAPTPATNSIPAIQPSNAPTPATNSIPAIQPSNAPTPATNSIPAVQPSSGQTVERFNGSTVERSNGSTVERSNEPPVAPPASLSGHTLAPISRQGELVTLRGRLEPLSSIRAFGGARYRLVDKAGFSKSTVICHIIGLDGQWHELAGSEIEIEGRLWTLRDSISETLPVIDASRVRRIASWEK